MPTSTSPEYEQPPVSESILGVQFELLPNFKNGHLGAFWRQLGPEWPNVADAPSLEQEFERFDDSARWQKLRLQLQLTQEPSFRIQIKNKDADKMIQVQNGRLHFNWLGGKYPRYNAVLEGFSSALEKFKNFLVQENLGEFRPNQWEVTYLNQIDRGSVWERPPDWEFFRPLATVPQLESLANLESFNGDWHYVIPTNRGRLHVQWQHGQQQHSKQETI